MFQDGTPLPVKDRVLGQVSRDVTLVDDFFSIIQPELDYDQDGQISLQDIISFSKYHMPRVHEEDLKEVCIYLFTLNESTLHLFSIESRCFAKSTQIVMVY